MQLLFSCSFLSRDPHEFAFSWSQGKTELPVLSQPWSGVGTQEPQALVCGDPRIQAPQVTHPAV